MFLTLWSSRSVTDSHPAPSSTPPCGPRLKVGRRLLRKVQTVAFSAASRKATRLTALPLGAEVDRYEKAQIATVREVALDAPAVALGVFERALHLFPQDFRQDGAAHGARTWLSDIGRPVPPGEHSLQRLLDPIRFQRKAESVSQHHRGAENRADRISRVRPGEGRRRTMNGLKKRRGRSKAGRRNQPN